MAEADHQHERIESRNPLQPLQIRPADLLVKSGLKRESTTGDHNGPYKPQEVLREHVWKMVCLRNLLC